MVKFCTLPYQIKNLWIIACLLNSLKDTFVLNSCLRHILEYYLHLTDVGALEFAQILHLLIFKFALGNLILQLPIVIYKILVFELKLLDLIIDPLALATKFVLLLLELVKQLKVLSVQFSKLTSLMSILETNIVKLSSDFFIF